jgi:hypothetical protein
MGSNRERMIYYAAGRPVVVDPRIAPQTNEFVGKVFAG